LSTVQGQAASPNIITGQNLLFWLLHSWESNWYQKQKVRRFEGRLLQRVPYSKRALLEESEIYITSVFKTCKAACGVQLAGRSSQAFHQANCFPVTNCGSHTFPAL